MRTQIMKNYNGDVKFGSDDDWPLIIVRLSDDERVIYSADGGRLMLQYRWRHDVRREKWSKWGLLWWTESHEKMRQRLESYNFFKYDSDKLDAICLKTDDGDFVEHSH